VDYLLIDARVIHFAATISAAGVVFFVVFIAEPAFRKAPDGARMIISLRSWFAWIAWISLALSVMSGAAWLVLTAASMSGQTLSGVFSQGVLWTVLSRTDFGNDWLARFVLACVLAGTFLPLLSRPGAQSTRLKAAAVVFAALLVGSLAFAGHAIGSEGIEGILHPAADVLHLIAASAWVGMLVPLALLLMLTAEDAAALAVARTATLRFSSLGIAAVAALLLTGTVNTWYLVGSIEALTSTGYGQLLLFKLALFVGMVGIAAFNWSQLTPRLVQNADAVAAQAARRQLRRNALVEASAGAIIIAIVAVLGTLPPASHAHHEAAASAIPADASFVHIHGENGMAEVTIEPGHTGISSATIRLWDQNFDPASSADEVTLTLTAPTPGSKPITRIASQGADGLWHVEGIELPQPGNWMVGVTAEFNPTSRLSIAAPIVIDPKK
jgi:copper resistance protein D